MFNDGPASKLDVQTGPTAEAGLGRDLNYIWSNLGFLSEW